MLLLGPGLAYLYGTFGCTVGKLVGQYLDSDRVSHSAAESIRGRQQAGRPISPGRRERGGAAYKPEGEEIDSVPGSHCGD